MTIGTLTLKDPLARKVIQLIKTTTLRTKQWKDGEYIITIKNRNAAKVKLTALYAITDYTQLSQREKEDLAAREGGFTVQEFEDLLRKISFYGKTPYADFLTGERTLWLHEIKLLETYDA